MTKEKDSDLIPMKTAIAIIVSVLVVVLLIGGLAFYFMFGGGINIGDSNKGLREDFVLELKRIDREVEKCYDYQELNNLLQTMYTIIDRIEMVDTTKNNKTSNYIKHITSTDYYTTLKEEMYEEYMLDPTKDDILFAGNEGQLVKAQLFVMQRLNVKTSVYLLLSEDKYYDKK